MSSHIDVVIPVHTEERRVERAIRSARSDAQGVDVRVTVVLHNMEPSEEFIDRISDATTIIRHHDGLRSPSGPRNAGRKAGAGEFVFFLDSDDVLAPRCLARLRTAAVELDADVALPRLDFGGRFAGSPLDTGWGPRLLDPVRHELFMRSNVPALLRRAALDRLSAFYPEGVRTGEDLAMMAQLYVQAKTTHVASAVYVVGSDGDARASETVLPAAEQLAGVRAILDGEWWVDLTPAQELVLCRRLLSINLAWMWRRLASSGDVQDPEEYSTVRDLIIARRPETLALLSVRDRVTLRLEPRPNRARRLLMARPFGLVPSHPRGAFNRSGPTAIAIRSWVVRRPPWKVRRARHEP